ncbi:MAG TPA: glycosyltransferase [Solirubrobacteraceae bacterium]
MEALQIRLDAPLPSELAVGEGTALFVSGTCFHASTPVAGLEFELDGASSPVTHHGMPRLDLFRSLHPGLDPFATEDVLEDPDAPDDPRLHSYRSGFWGVVEVPAGAGPVCRLTLRAHLQDGGEVTGPLAEIRVVELPAPVPLPWPPPAGPGASPEPHDGPLVAICMATYEPPMGLFRRQIETIRAQTHRNWVCLISDDRSSPARLTEIHAVTDGDPRFIVSASPRRLGFYLNFERALSLAPANAEYVALSDQDDAWYPDKLATLLAEIGDARLAYSDTRVVTETGEVVSDTYWVTRRSNHHSLSALLITNSVTGGASLLGRDLLEHALPFPPPQFAHFHDHWLAVVALCLGDIVLVPRPLYDYVQHADASLGHAVANRMPGLHSRLGRILADPHERVVSWRHHYFIDACRLTVWATIARRRCAARMPAAKTRELDRFLAIDQSWRGLADLWRRGAREILGLRSETLGAEWMLAYAFTWRRLLSASVRDRPVRRLRLDAVPPPELHVPPGRPLTPNPELDPVRAMAEKVMPLGFVASPDAPARVNLLIPSIDLEHLFGGYIAKFNLARRLAAVGHRVRIVTVDPHGSPTPGFRAEVERYAGLEGLFDEVELAFGRESRGLEVNPRDGFIATTWWTAHIAHAAVRELGRERFLYLIQEYEPFTFPMGSYAALAAESYTFPHTALFSTELLRDYFRRHRIGVFAEGARAGNAASASFQNAITAVPAPTAAELVARGSRRLLFYARPEDHARRNLFELGVLALAEAVRSGALVGWELRATGTVGGARSLALGHGARLTMLPRAGQSAYADLLRDHDLGLALMYTPHPSLVPIEMASAGMVTVTNSFENKTAETMAAISSNLLAPEPTVDAIAQALATAAGRATDYDARAAGAAVDWSRDWQDSFGPRLLVRVAALLA